MSRAIVTGSSAPYIDAIFHVHFRSNAELRSVAKATPQPPDASILLLVYSMQRRLWGNKSLIADKYCPPSIAPKRSKVGRGQKKQSSFLCLSFLDIVKVGTRPGWTWHGQIIRLSSDAGVGLIKPWAPRLCAPQYDFFSQTMASTGTLGIPLAGSQIRASKGSRGCRFWIC